MVKISEFKSCKYELPEKNGYYLVVGLKDDGICTYACALEYTKEYGWNTSLYYHDSVMTFDEDYVWAEVECKKDNSEGDNE